MTCAKAVCAISESAVYASSHDSSRPMASESTPVHAVKAVFETPIISRAQIDDPARKAAVFQLEVPPGSLPTGLYTCQVNIIDSVAGKFAFPRMQFLLR